MCILRIKGEVYLTFIYYFKDGVFDQSTTVIGIFPSPMLYAGPTEVQWHAKARRNCGAGYFVVKRERWKIYILHYFFFIFKCWG